MDIQQAITRQIVAAMEAGKTNGAALWSGAGRLGMPYNFKTKQQYSGVNVLLLWIAARQAGYSTAAYLTYKQAQELGGQVKKNACGTMGVFYSKVARETINEATGETKQTSASLMKLFWLFNLDQIEGIDRTATYVPTPFEAIEQAERVLQGSGAVIHIGGTRAFYHRQDDAITLPDRERFAKPENFYAVGLHELTHWTGAESRLDRVKGKRFGDEAYAFEELVAELGSAFLMADLGLHEATLEFHANYVESWISALNDDKRCIFSAAKQAGHAYQYIKDLQTPDECKQAA